VVTSNLLSEREPWGKNREGEKKAKEGEKSEGKKDPSLPKNKRRPFGNYFKYLLEINIETAAR
jgi:hypothetical protein